MRIGRHQCVRRASPIVQAFLQALAAEAADGRQLLMDLERAWFAARAAVAGLRRDSHAAAAVDVLAAVPLLSATSLAARLGLAVKTAIWLLDGLVAAWVVAELNHRSKRRFFGLNGMEPLRKAVRPPYRPEPGRGRGRPPILIEVIAGWRGDARKRTLGMARNLSFLV